MIVLDAIKARLARVAGTWRKGILGPGVDDFGPKAWAAHGPLRCHATEKGRARQWKQANADADLIAHAPTDIAALVAEVERLRAEVECERGAVVAWLRDRDKWCREWNKRENAVSATYRIAAESIESGDHRREEETK